jgi:hypothetical protein
MKTANPITVLPTRTRIAQEHAHPAGRLAKGRAVGLAWRVVAIVLAIALAQLTFRSIRSSVVRAHPGGPPLAAGVASGGSGAAPAWSGQGFRDEARCDLMGEPVECR